MPNVLIAQPQAFTEPTAEERQRLLRYCTRVTGDPQLAEDLVQQTLLEAWQHAHRVHTPALRQAWLYGVARHVCLRWLRRHGREQARQVNLTDDDPFVSAGNLFDELERGELASLLRDALALLPPATRDVLVGRYLEDLPQATLAAQLGVSEGAVEARLQRGKRALRRLLSTTFRNQLAELGDVAPATGDWTPTRLWCPVCGQHRLLAQMPEPPGVVAFRCPGCEPDPAVPSAQYRLTNHHFARLIGHLSRPSAVMKRVGDWSHDYFRQAIEHGCAACTHCGHVAQVQVEPDPAGELSLRVLVNCPRCGEAVSSSSKGVVQALPPVRRFWRQHGRIRMMPAYPVEAEGEAALVTRFESLSSSAVLSVVLTRDRFRLLHVAGDGPKPEDD